MQILLLATGESDKLQPVTNMVPAPLLPVANRPLLLYPLELLARQNQKHIWVALHNQAGHIESYLGKGERWGVKLDYLLQRKALGNGGAVRQAASVLGNDLLLVVPGDTVIDFDVEKLVAFHRAHGACLTVLVSSEGSAESGQLMVDPAGRVCPGGMAGGSGRSYYDTGLYLLSPECIQHILAGKHIDIHSQLIPLLLDKGLAVCACESHDYWNALGSFSAYQDFQKLLLTNGNSNGTQQAVPDGQPALQPYWQRSRRVAEGIWIGRNTVIHPNVRLQPPVVVGDNCYVGAGVQLGPTAVIGNNVIIDEEATILNTAVFNGTYVGQLVNLENRLVNKGQVVDIATGQAVQITDQFLVGRAFQTVSDTGLFQLLEKFTALILLLSVSWLMVLIGLLSLITQRKVLSRTTYYHSDIQSSWRNSSFTPRPLLLWEFVTRNKQGALTGYGRWLERWNFHRLPQLWNVVSGELALVGVKPLTEAEISFIQEEWHQKRFERKAGVTGLWFVQTQALGGIEGILVADTYYIATHTWRVDLRILKQTVPAWWRMGRQEHRHRTPQPVGTSK
ncbi:MAG: sugar transferase [Anaerolineaceae bacterium]|nr:sugar transferase [Anaerolineaceae bacterium]